MRGEKVKLDMVDTKIGRRVMFGINNEGGEQEDTEEEKWS